MCNFCIIYKNVYMIKVFDCLFEKGIYIFSNGYICFYCFYFYIMFSNEFCCFFCSFWIIIVIEENICVFFG